MTWRKTDDCPHEGVRVAFVITHTDAEGAHEGTLGSCECTPPDEAILLLADEVAVLSDDPKVREALERLREAVGVQT